MLTEEQWRQFERLLVAVRGYERDGEMLMFTSRSIADLLHRTMHPLLRGEDEASTLEAYGAGVDDLLGRVHATAHDLNGTVEHRGQTFRIVSETVADRVNGWMNDNCPRGLD